MVTGELVRSSPGARGRGSSAPKQEPSPGKTSSGPLAKRSRKPIDCAVALIQCLASSSTPLGVTELANRSGLTKSNVCRTLEVLEKVRWVRQDRQTSKYSVGTKILEIGLSMAANLDLRTISLPHLTQLRDTIGETTLLVLLVGQEQMPIEQVQCNHELRTVIQLGKARALWSSATGKVLLAYLGEDEINRVIDDLIQSGVRVMASGQIIDIPRLREELVEIRRQGFAVTVGERLVGVAATAAPILNHDRRPVAAISVGGPLPRFTLERAREVGPEVVRVAKRISMDLGSGG